MPTSAGRSMPTASGASRLTALAKDGDLGWDYSKDDRLYVAPALTIKPDEGTSLTILTDYYKRNGTGARGFPTGANLDINTFLGEPDFNRFNTRESDFGYQFEHEINNGLTLSLQCSIYASQPGLCRGLRSLPRSDRRSSGLLGGWHVEPLCDRQPASIRYGLENL